VTPRRIFILAVVLAAFLRLWAAWQLPVDFDEPLYLRAAFDYAEAIRAGDLNAIVDYSQNREHPPLTKLLYSLVVLAQGQAATFDNALFATRALSALFGTLTVVIIALLNPWAGVMLAVHTLTVKYTSQAYLDALPHFTSLVAVLAFRRAASSRSGWLWFSAFMLGLTGAGKYSYAPILIVLVYLSLWAKNWGWRQMFPYLAVAALTFFAFDPALWREPLTRLADSIFFHAQYTQGADVQAAAYETDVSSPWYQPLIWIARSNAADWHPDVFFYYGFDAVIFLFALGGLPFEWRERQWAVVWLVSGFLILLVWPTKWPQYAMLILPPLCLCAATGATRFYHWVMEQETYWGWLKTMILVPPRVVWLALAAFAFFVTAIYVGGAAMRALGGIGWSHYTPANSPLPDSTINALNLWRGKHMAIGADAGLAIWSPPENDQPPRWQIFSTGNSGLPHDRVLALAEDGAGALWVGTENGLVQFDGEAWQPQLPGRIEGIAVGDDQVWAATLAGAARLADGRWTTFTTANSGLGDDAVFSIALQGDVVWMGTVSGVSRFETVSDSWATFTADNSDLGVGGVADLLIDSEGMVWAATQGGGLSQWDGRGWRSYLTSNSTLPHNTVNVIFEIERGRFWIGTALPLDVGGVLATFDGQRWRTLRPANSGFSGSEPLTIAKDSQGRIWIGTQSAGADIYDPADK
jgi:hypothetical protein